MCCLCLLSPEAGGWWNTRGCEVVSKEYGYTVCHCNHTTNFALLLQVYEAQVTFPSQTMTVCRLSFTAYAAIYSSRSVCVRMCVLVRGVQRAKTLCRC